MFIKLGRTTSEASSQDIDTIVNMPLMALPTEIITRIIFLVDPTTVPNVATISKYIYACAELRLREPRSMKSYRQIRLDSREPERTLRILGEIRRNPQISFYARRLHVHGDAGALQRSMQGFTNDTELPGLSPFGPLLTILSMHFLCQLTSIYMTDNSDDCDAWHELQHIFDTYPLGIASQLQSLEITVCVDPRWLSRLLHSCGCLESFFGTPEPGHSPPLEVWSILQRYASETLKDLRFHYQDVAAISLQGFRALQRITLYIDIETPLCRILLVSVAELYVLENSPFDNGLAFCFRGFRLADFPLLRQIGIVVKNYDYEIDAMECTKAAFARTELVQETPVNFETIGKESGKIGVYLQQPLEPNRLVFFGI